MRTTIVQPNNYLQGLIKPFAYGRKFVFEAQRA